MGSALTAAPPCPGPAGQVAVHPLLLTGLAADGPLRARLAPGLALLLAGGLALEALAPALLAAVKWGRTWMRAGRRWP